MYRVSILYIKHNTVQSFIAHNSNILHDYVSKNLLIVKSDTFDRYNAHTLPIKFTVVIYMIYAKLRGMLTHKMESSTI